MIIDYLRRSIGRCIFLRGSTMWGMPLWTICSTKDVPDRYKNLVGEDSFRKALKELGDIGRTREIQIIFFSEEKIEPSYKEVHENIYYLNADKEQRRYLLSHQNQWLDLVISKKDPHPSKTGHGVMAEAIYNQLVDGKFIERLMTGKTDEGSE